MAAPVSETIVADVIAALEAVTVQAGYNNTIETVKRFDGEETTVDGARPAAMVRFLGDSYDRVLGDSGRGLSTQVSITALAKVDPTSGVPLDKQVNLLAHDINLALFGMGFNEADYDLGAVVDTPMATEDSDEPADGVRVVVTFHCSVDYIDIETIVGPGV